MGVRALVPNLFLLLKGKKWLEQQATRRIAGKAFAVVLREELPPGGERQKAGEEEEEEERASLG